MLKKLLSSLSLVLVLLAFFTSTSLAQTYYPTVYVSLTNGAGTNTGQNEFNNPTGTGPLNTIDQGLRKVQNGGTLIILADTYSEDVNINFGTYTQITSGITITLAPLRDVLSLAVINSNINLNGNFTFNIVGGTLTVNTGTTPATQATLVQLGTIITLLAGNINLNAATTWTMANLTTINMVGSSIWTNAAPGKAAATNSIFLIYTGGSSFVAGAESNYGSYGASGSITINKTAGTTVTLPNNITKIGTNAGTNDGIVGLSGNAIFSGTVAMGMNDIDNNGTCNLTFNNSVAFAIGNNAPADATIGQVENHGIGTIIFNAPVSWAVSGTSPLSGGQAANLSFGNHLIRNQGNGSLLFNNTMSVAGDPTANSTFTTNTLVLNQANGTLKLGFMTTDALSIVNVTNNAAGGILNIQGGTYNGYLANAASATVNLGGNTTFGGQLLNAGSIAESTFTLTLAYGGVLTHLTNGGTITGTGRIIVTGTPALFNGGTLGNVEVASGAAGTLGFGSATTNVGTFTLTSGAVTLTNVTLNVVNYNQNGGSFTLTNNALSIINTTGNFNITTASGTFIAPVLSTVSFTGGTAAQSLFPGANFQCGNLIFNNTYAPISVGNSMRANNTITNATGTIVTLSSLNLVLNGGTNVITNNGTINATGGGGVVLGGVNLITGGVGGATEGAFGLYLAWQVPTYQLAGTGVYQNVIVDVGTGNYAQVTTTASVGCKWSQTLTLYSGDLDVQTAAGLIPIDFGPASPGATIVRYPEKSQVGLHASIGTFNALNNYPYNVYYTSYTAFGGSISAVPLTAARNVGIEITGQASPLANANVNLWWINTTGAYSIDLPGGSNVNFVGSLIIDSAGWLNLPTGIATAFIFNPSYFTPQIAVKTQFIYGKITLADGGDKIAFFGNHVVDGATANSLLPSPYVAVNASPVATLGYTEIENNANVTVQNIKSFTAQLTTLGSSTLTLGSSEPVSGNLTIGASTVNLASFNLTFKGANNTVDPSATITGTGAFIAGATSGNQTLNAPAGATSAFTIPNLIIKEAAAAPADPTAQTLVVGGAAGAQNLIVSNSLTVTTGDLTIADGKQVIVTGNTITLSGAGSDILVQGLASGILVTNPTSGILTLSMNPALRTIPNLTVNGPTALATVTGSTGSSTLLVYNATAGATLGLRQTANLDLAAWNLLTNNFIRTTGSNLATTGYLEYAAGLSTLGFSYGFVEGIGFSIPNLKISTAVTVGSVNQNFTVTNNLYLNNCTFTTVNPGGSNVMNVGVTGGAVPNIIVEGAGNVDVAPTFPLGKASYVFANTAIPLTNTSITGGQISISSNTSAYRQVSITSATATGGVIANLASNSATNESINKTWSSNTGYVINATTGGDAYGQFTNGSYYVDVTWITATPHYLKVGEKVKVYDAGSFNNGSSLNCDYATGGGLVGFVTSTPTATHFTVREVFNISAFPGPVTWGETVVSGQTAKIESYYTPVGYVVLQCNSVIPYAVGDRIVVTNEPTALHLNGEWVVTGVSGNEPDNGGSVATLAANEFRILAPSVVYSTGVAGVNFVGAAAGGVNGSVDITTSTPHGLMVGQFVTFSAFAGSYPVTAVVSPTVFRVTLPYTVTNYHNVAATGIPQIGGTLSYTGAGGNQGKVTISAANHTFANGQTIVIAGALPVGANGEPTLNGTWVISNVVTALGVGVSFDITLAGKSNAAILGTPTANYVTPSSVAVLGDVDVTTSTPHGFSVGNSITISGGALAGTYTVLAVSPLVSPTVFTIAWAGGTGLADIAAPNASYSGYAYLTGTVVGDVIITTALPTSVAVTNPVVISGVTASTGLNGTWAASAVLSPFQFRVTVPGITVGGSAGSLANVTQTVVAAAGTTKYWPSATSTLAQDLSVNYSPLGDGVTNFVATPTGAAVYSTGKVTFYVNGATTASRTVANNLFLQSGVLSIQSSSGNTTTLTLGPAGTTTPILTKYNTGLLVLNDGGSTTLGVLAVPTTGLSLVYATNGTTATPQGTGVEYSGVSAVNNFTVNALVNPLTINFLTGTIKGNMALNDNVVLNATGTPSTTTLVGNLTLAANKTLTINPSNTLLAQGNITLASGAAIAGSGSLTFGGALAQAVTFSSANSTVSNLTINKSANDVKMTGGNLTITGLLNLISGDIITGATNVLNLTPPTHGAVFNGTAISQGYTGGSSASMVVGNVAKTFKNDNTVFNSTEEINRFPVGDGTNYRPIALTFNSAFGFPTVPNNITITANFTNSTPGGAVGLPIANGVASGINIARYPSFYWGLSTSGTVSPSLVFDLEVVAAGYTMYDDVNNIRIIRRYGVGTDVANEWDLQGDAADYDNTLNATVPTVISKNSTGGLRTGGAIFTLGLKSNMSVKTPIAKQWLVWNTTTSENRPISVSNLFKGNVGSLTYVATSSNTAVATVHMSGPTTLVVAAQGLGDCIVTVTATDATTNDFFAFSFPVNVGPTDVASTEQLPTEFALFQNFPNPFNPTTNIRFDLPKESNVTLKIYNVLGEEVAKLVDKVMPAGHQSVTFDATKLASGMYIYRIQAADFVQVKKMLLMK